MTRKSKLKGNWCYVFCLKEFTEFLLAGRSKSVRPRGWLLEKCMVEIQFAKQPCVQRQERIWCIVHCLPVYVSIIRLRIKMNSFSHSFGQKYLRERQLSPRSDQTASTTWRTEESGYHFWQKKKKLNNALKNCGSSVPPLQSALGKFPLEKSDRGINPNIDIHLVQG